MSCLLTFCHACLPIAVFAYPLPRLRTYLLLAVWPTQDKLPHTDQYVLRWESDWLVTLGKSVEVSNVLTG